MSVLKRALVAITMLAVTFGLASVPALTTAANAAPANPAACAQAQSDVAAKTTAVKKATKAKKKATKALKKAKKKAAKAAVKKAVKKVAKAKKKLKKAKAAKAAAVKVRNVKCKDVAANPAGDPLGQLLALLSQSGSLPGNVGGADGNPINVTQLNGLLALLGGGNMPNLDPAMLLGILNGFNNSPLDPAALSGLLDGVLDPAAITALLSGGADPAALLGLFEGLLAQFTSLGGTSALPVPDLADVLDLFSMFETGLGALTGLLDPAQLGSLLGLLANAGALAGGNEALGALDLGQLTALLTSLIGGDAFAALDPTDLTALLGGFNNLPTDPAAVFALFGGLLDPAQLLALLTGTAGDQVFGQALAQMLSTFSVLTGGEFAFPSGLDLGVLTGLVDTVIDLVDDLLGGLLGGGGGIPIVCDLLPLPILCD